MTIPKNTIGSQVRSVFSRSITRAYRQRAWAAEAGTVVRGQPDTPQNAASRARWTAVSASGVSGYEFAITTTVRSARGSVHAALTYPPRFPVWPIAGPHGVVKAARP